LYVEWNSMLVIGKAEGVLAGKPVMACPQFAQGGEE
jgi:hypothetical protein